MRKSTKATKAVQFRGARLIFHFVVFRIILVVRSSSNEHVVDARCSFACRPCPSLRFPARRGFSLHNTRFVHSFRVGRRYNTYNVHLDAAMLLGKQGTADVKEKSKFVITKSFRPVAVLVPFSRG